MAINITSATKCLATDAHGVSAFHRCKTAKEVDALALCDFDERALDRKGLTPLHYACRDGNLEVALALIAVNPEVLCDTTPIGDTPLHVLCGRGWSEMVGPIVKHGADVNAKGRAGWTPLHFASQQAQIKTARSLVEHGADVNAKTSTGVTPLHVASSHGHFGLVRELIALGADKNAETSTGKTPQMLCKTHDLKLLFATEPLKPTEPSKPDFSALVTALKAVVAELEKLK